MPIVDENRLKGNYGASIVMARLSGQCLVRPAAIDTDVGVDLYCETVIEGQPFLHFWLQVKAGSQCKQDMTGQKASCRFSLDQLKYWTQQPVPVFAALVPTSWPAQSEPSVYIIDITSQVVSGNITKSQASIVLTSDHVWPAGDKEAVRVFMTEVVPITTSRLQISKGLVPDIPTLTPQYIQTRPIVPVRRFKEPILYQLRTTAANSIISMFASDNKETTDDVEFRRLLARIVEQFGDDQHWENFMSRALSSHADEDYEKALAMYEKARNCIQADVNVCNEPTWQEIVSAIQGLEEKARSKEKL